MIKHLSDTLTATVDLFVDRKSRGGVPYIGIPTGFPKMDKIFTGGLRPNNLYVIAGRTGMGKSAMGLSKALNIARNGETVLYVTLEMSNEILITRILSSMTNIPAQTLEYGRFNDQQYHTLVQAQAELMNLPLYTIDEVVDSRTVIDTAKGMETLSTLFVDHASLLNDPIVDSEVTRVSNIVRTLRHGATELDIPIVALAQLNRQSEFREPPRPILSDLKQSGNYEEEASVVILLYRPGYYDGMKGNARDEKFVETDAEIIVAKNRFGPTGKIIGKFYTTKMKWEEA